MSDLGSQDIFVKPGPRKVKTHYVCEQSNAAFSQACENSLILLFFDIFEATYHQLNVTIETHEWSRITVISQYFEDFGDLGSSKYQKFEILRVFLTTKNFHKNLTISSSKKSFEIIIF